jgi:hypothetical protein
MVQAWRETGRVENRSGKRAESYSGFDSGLYRILDAKWHFSKEKATLHDLQMTTFESKSP